MELEKNKPLKPECFASLPLGINPQASAFPEADKEALALLFPSLLLLLFLPSPSRSFPLPPSVEILTKNSIHIKNKNQQENKMPIR